MFQRIQVVLMKSRTACQRPKVNPSPRSTFAAAFAVALIFASQARPLAKDDDALYGRRIVIPVASAKPLKAVVDDLSTHLHKMTGAEFKIQHTPAEAGIFLVNADSPLAPAGAAKALEGKGKEAFLVRSPRAGQLFIVATTDMGLSHGAYYYLEQLGCRWFMPGDNWTIIPRRDSIELKIDHVSAPAFKMRAFSGTGGFGGKLPIDPEMRLQGRWEDWKRRNRFGGEFALAGHAGEAFNTKYKAILQEHPEYLAEIDGKRVPWSLIAKPCISNPDVVKLYARDRVDDFRRRQANPNEPHAFAVSVEPADGGGHCECEKCRKLGTISDRVFTLANAVAIEVAGEFPKGRVSLFAYNQHAAVPSIPIEPNVYVTVIPYGFQRTELSPEELLTTWGHKVGALSMYDYWSIPDWAHDLPNFNYLKTAPERLRFWKKNGVEGFLSESTFSGGAMGAAWYLSGRLMWDPQADEKAVFDDFYKGSFGPAAEPMKRMLERWAANFTFTTHELALSFRDLEEAHKRTADTPAARARVLDFGRYVHYLRLWFEYQRAAAEDKAEATQALWRHLWGIHSTAMVHSFRLFQLTLRSEALKRPELLNLYKYADPATAEWWKKLRPVADDEVERMIADGVKHFQPLDFESRSFTGKLVPLSTPVAQSAEWASEMTLGSGTKLELDVPKGVDKFRLRISGKDVIRVTAVDAEGEPVFAQRVEVGERWREQWSELEIPAAKPGRCTVSIWSPKRTYRIQAPTGIPLSMREWVNSQGAPTPRLHFFVPKGLTTIATYLPYIAAGPPRFFDPDGKEVKPVKEDGGVILLVKVLPGQDGKVWSISHLKAPSEPLRMLNAPQAFAFSPDALLIPEDVKR
jgi:hypothetical protein